MVTGSTPILAVSEMSETLEFYSNVLGFKKDWQDGEPPSMAGASWGKVSLMFSLQPEIAAHIEGHGLWFSVEGVDELYSQHQARGAEILSPIEDKPWGFREYTVRDLNGYHLRFTQPASYTPKGVQGSMEGVTVERRKPSLDEYRQVVGEGFYKEVDATSYVERSWAGVVAKNPDGQVIGTTRIVNDA